MPPDDEPVTEFEDPRRDAPSLLPALPPVGVADPERNEEDEIVRGADGGAGEDPLEAVEVAETDRPRTGGDVGADDVTGVLGFEAGLSQDEKKSSSSALAAGGVAATSAPSTNILVGYLQPSHALSVTAQELNSMGSIGVLCNILFDTFCELFLVHIRNATTIFLLCIRII